MTLLAVGAVVFFAARSFGGMKYNDVEDSAKQLISASGTGTGYPYKISSADVLDMTINRAVEFFENVPQILNKIKEIQDVGL